jgi:hypothetical protein
MHRRICSRREQKEEYTVKEKMKRWEEKQTKIKKGKEDKGNRREGEWEEKKNCAHERKITE